MTCYKKVVDFLIFKTIIEMGEKLDASLHSGAHHHLARLAGNWEGTTTVWFEPDQPPADQSPVKGSIRAIMGGRFMLHEYTGSFGGKPLEGLAIIGYHLDLQRYQCAWIDSFHNGSALMFSESAVGSESINVLGNYFYVSPELTQKWGWRTEIEVVHDDEIRITAFNVTPEGEESKATETIYKRVNQ